MAFSSIGDLWNKWNVRGFVILSLFLQIFLILFAPIRKKTGKESIFSLLWLAYLMADRIAAFTIGLISHNQGNSLARVAQVDEALQAFWASFLLLHLGGPDTITAFSVEDSSLWKRHLLSVIFQAGAAIYVFGQIFPTDKSLAVPTVLIFLIGVMKNTERIVALNLSSLPNLRKHVLSQLNAKDDECDKSLEEFTGLGEEYSNGEEAKLDESIVVMRAYYFKIFKVFLTNLIFTDQQRKMNHEYFHKVSAVDALRLISVELQFIYEMLYTKTLAIRSIWSHIFRFMAFSANVTALILFNHLKKHRFPELDVKITYSLLLGGIFLDVMALFMFVFSDWTIAKIKCCQVRPSILHLIICKLVSATDHLREPTFATCELEPNTNVTYRVLDTPLRFRRWSENIPACNLLSEKFGTSPRKMYKRDRHWGIIRCLAIGVCPFYMADKIVRWVCQTGGCASGFSAYGSQAMVSNTKHISKNPFIMKLWIFIFKEVREKSKNTDDPNVVRKIFEAKGDLFLESKSESGEIDCSRLLEYITDTNYDTSIILWHLATEMWYNREKQSMSSGARNDEMEYSKILSDYMFYLVVNQADVMSAVAGMAQVTSGRTLLQLNKPIFDGSNDVMGLCESLFKVPLDGITSRTLSRGLQLARDMEVLGKRKWEVMSGVWVEILSYAAIHIKGEMHVKVLSEGGELLAFVWLLMAHFGCFNRPIFHPRVNSTAGV